MSEPNRVMVTGLGLITPLGIGVDATTTALRDGSCGLSFGNAREWLGSNYWSGHYGAVRGFAPEDYIEDRRSIRKSTRSIHLAVSAARLALADANWQEPGDVKDQYSAGVVIAMGIEESNSDFNPVLEAALDDAGQFSYQRCGSLGASRCPPLYILPRLPNTAAGQIAILNKIKGINFSVVNNTNGGVVAIGEAYRAIRNGRASMVITGGCNSPIGILPTYRTNTFDSFDLSHRGSAPFSADRKGYIPAEGAAILVLESERSAKARGVRIYAELKGYANLYEPKVGMHLEVESAAYRRAIQATLTAAGTNAADVSCINASGIGLPLQDAAESCAIREIFGRRPIPVTGTKAQTGYMETASSALEACVSAISVRQGLVPSTIRWKGGDPLCDLDYVANGSREQAVEQVLSMSFDLKGSLCGLVFSKYSH